MGDQMVSWVAL